jgi:hypothetical protein
MVNPPQPTSGLSNAMLGSSAAWALVAPASLPRLFFGRFASEPYESIYVSLGDSIAAGSGASDRNDGVPRVARGDEAWRPAQRRRPGRHDGT